MSGWEENVRRVRPYIPGEQPKDENIIKLNTNENPYPPSPKVRQAILDFDEGMLRKYPDPTADELLAALSDTYHVPKNRIFVGVGSDDVLAMSFLTFFHGKKPVWFPDITYSFYDVWAEEFEIPYETKELDDHLHIVPEDYFGENGGIVIPNPNAPTGIACPVYELERIVAQNPDSVVIIDEAYGDFYGDSALPLIRKYDNLLIVMTFSKSRALAGSRIGFAFGSEKLIGYLNDVKYGFNSYTMDSLTIKIACAALSDEAYYAKRTAEIVKTREYATKELENMGFSCTASRTNFIYASHEKYAAKEIFEYLRNHGIYVRYFDHKRIDNYLRITVGTREEMDELIRSLHGFIG